MAESPTRNAVLPIEFAFSQLQGPRCRRAADCPLGKAPTRKWKAHPTLPLRLPSHSDEDTVLAPPPQTNPLPDTPPSPGPHCHRYSAPQLGSWTHGWK